MVSASALVLHHIVHEGLVHFQDVDREALQVAERRVPGAEVVDGEGHAQLLEGQHPGDDRLGVLDEDILGDLEHQGVGVEFRLLQRLGHITDQAVVLEVSRRDVDTQAEGTGFGRSALPRRACSARGQEYPSAERHDEAGLLGQADEVLREQAGRVSGWRQRTRASSPIPAPRSRLTMG